MKTNKKIKDVEYWFDGQTSSYQVDKKDYYNDNLSCFNKFRLITFNDGSQMTCI
jgi:hypothetical protein